LAGAVQDKGAALLLHGHPDLERCTGADGAHLDGVDHFKAALSILKPERIAGCGGLASKHDAIVRPALDAVLERVAWWAELFETPCVGFAGSLEEVGPLAAAGADFVALGDCVFADNRGCAAAVTEAARRIGTVGAPV
jgi:thiamine-phosphate pyrophosphorylase